MVFYIVKYMKTDFVRLAVLCWKSKVAKNGQAMIEYAVMTALLLSTALILTVFLYTYKQHSERIVNLVASEYP